MPDQAAARQTDATEHGGVIMDGSADVLVNDLGAARVTDYHTCPEETPAGVPHIGGPIEKGSESVFINDLQAARVKDPLVCLKTPVEPSNCEGEGPGKGGREKKQIGKSKTDKSFLYGLDAKGTCRLYRPFDESAEGVLGKIKGTVEAGRIEGKAQLGYSHDRIKNKGFAGLDAGLGGALLDGRAKYETPQLPIPFTNYGLSLQVEGFGAIGAAELKGKLGVEWENGKGKFEIGAKIAAGLGLGLKFGLAWGPLKPEIEVEVQDLVQVGSPDVLIGG